MKKTILIPALSSLFLLAGCTDASAALSDSGTTIMKVGDTAITKGEVYTLLRNVAGVETVLSGASNIIYDTEVELTDEMVQEAQDSLDSMKELYGDSFDSYLSYYGLTEETYYNEYLLASLKADALTSKYIEDNFDDLVTSNNPIKAIVLSFQSEEDANAALSALNDGSLNAVDVADLYDTSESGEEEIFTLDSTGYSTVVTALIRSAQTDDGWNYVSEGESGWYLVKVVENDANEMKDELLEYFASDSDISNDALIHYFEELNFRVYDIDLYNAIESEYPIYLVQNN